MECNFLSQKEKSFFKGKKVFLRSGINVPIKNGEIEGDFRLKAILPTLKFLSEPGAKVIMTGHIGREKENSLKPIFKWFKKELKKDNIEIFFNKDTFKKKFNLEDLENEIIFLKGGQVLLLDNLRATELEKENSSELSQKIFPFFDLYINEAFSVSHRNHMSVSALPSLFKKEKYFLGLRYEKELENLEKIKNPKKYQKKIFILGGAKIATKIPMLKSILPKFDLVILGGAVANNFYLEMDYQIGTSVYDKDFFFKEKELEKLIKTEKIFLPKFVITNNGEKEISKVMPNDKILDISPKSFQKIEKDLRKADFVFFNGPLGFYEGGYKKGTKYLLNILANPNNFFVAGGGDTASIIFELGLEKNIDFISTGGGALIKKISE